MVTNLVPKSETPLIKKILHLRIACYLYNQISNNDSGLIEILKKFKKFEPSNEAQIKYLLKWLRGWRCRQLKTEDSAISIKSIQDWYNKNKINFPKWNTCLLDFDLDKNKNDIVKIFNDLSGEIAAKRKLKSKMKVPVKIGSVGAAKTLFILRPNLFAPWDNKIRIDFGLPHDGSGYVEYLSKIKDELINIKNILKRSKETTWKGLFEYLNKDKEYKFYPKLIDEYYWMTITKKIKPSEIETKWPYKRE